MNKYIISALLMLTVAGTSHATADFRVKHKDALYCYVTANSGRMIHEALPNMSEAQVKLLGQGLLEQGISAKQVQGAIEAATFMNKTNDTFGVKYFNFCINTLKDKGI